MNSLPYICERNHANHSNNNNINSIQIIDKVALVGFGTFSVNERPAREGINLRTKEKIQIPAKKVAKFKAGAELTDALN